MSRRPCRRCVAAVAREIESSARRLRKAAEARAIPSAWGRMLHVRASEVAAVAEALRTATRGAGR
jgi:hypothetical protein